MKGMCNLSASGNKLKTKSYTWTYKNATAWGITNTVTCDGISKIEGIVSFRSVASNANAGYKDSFNITYSGNQITISHGTVSSSTNNITYTVTATVAYYK